MDNAKTADDIFRSLTYMGYLSCERDHEKHCKEIIESVLAKPGLDDTKAPAIVWDLIREGYVKGGSWRIFRSCKNLVLHYLLCRYKEGK